MDVKYYDGTKLLSMMDVNGRKPEVYMCTTNRTGGKTTWFGRLMVNRFKNKGEKFCLVYRYNYELDDVAETFFKDISSLFFQSDIMTSQRRANGIYHELFLNEVSCGYAVSLNSADFIKKKSHFFSDVSNMLMDEFQSETNHYCVKEVEKFQSIHKSIARGQGEQVRYVPVFMIANPVSIINPYYVAMHVSDRLRSDTKFLRGDGWVLEQGYVESASIAQEESGFNRAFASTTYSAYSAQGVYLNDNLAFIEKPEGRSTYVCSLKYNGADYAIREFGEQGIIYCDTSFDATFPIKICVTTDDHGVNYVMLKRSDFILSNLRYLFERGCFRFKDLRCKEAVLTALSY